MIRLENEGFSAGRDSMGRCIKHPDRDTSYLCSKHQIYICESCLRCRDPGAHCKYRSSCVIRAMEKEEKEEEKNSNLQQ